MQDLARATRIPPGSKVDLDAHPPDARLGLRGETTARERTAKRAKRMADLATMLMAEHKRAVLVVLQGMDASGKDGTIKHVMSGVNPAGCTVTSFKVPTAEEASHDFLWRIHKAVPPKGYIGIFNRSHYEDVLVTRVHKLVTESVWKSRYDRINEFEQLLVENHVVLLKFFLHISKEEQKQRFDCRREEADKNWKISDADMRERAFWNDYQSAYEDAIAKCSTKAAPWHVVPANKKWFRNLAVSQMIVDALRELNMKYPTRVPDVKGAKGKVD